MSETLIERLTRQEPTGYFTLGGGNVSCGDLQRASAYGGKPIFKLANPDGPEAATRIAMLEEAGKNLLAKIDAGDVCGAEIEALRTLLTNKVSSNDPE